jgi:hypothetical protein
MQHRSRRGPPAADAGQTWTRRFTASVISATASSTGTPFFCSPLRVAERHRPGGDVVVPCQQHVRHLLPLRGADLAPAGRLTPA